MGSLAVLDPAPRPADMLQRCVQASEPDPEAWQWLQAGLRAALHGQPLPAALGLEGRALLEVRLEARNALLRQALDLVDAPSRSARIHALAKAAVRFEAHRWPQWRTRDDPPEKATQLQALLFRARQFYSLPGSRQLHNLLADVQSRPNAIA